MDNLNQVFKVTQLVVALKAYFKYAMYHHSAEEKSKLDHLMFFLISNPPLPTKKLINI